MLCPNSVGQSYLYFISMNTLCFTKSTVYIPRNNFRQMMQLISFRDYADRANGHDDERLICSPLHKIQGHGIIPGVPEKVFHLRLLDVCTLIALFVFSAVRLSAKKVESALAKFLIRNLFK